MPIYEYECEKCRTRFELKRSFGEDGDACCPQCSSNASRIFTSVPIIFKGSGFYVTDHKANNSASTDKKDGEKTDTPATPAPAESSKKD